MATVDELEQKLMCSICLQLFVEPRLLPCGHTYCQHCLASFITSRPPATSSHGQQGFCCPVCRDFVPAPDRITPPQLWAHKLKPNFLIRDIVEAHGRQKRNLRRVSCPMHAGKALEVFCDDCKVTVCDRCVALEHRKCENVMELAEVSHEAQMVFWSHQQTIMMLLKQLDAKKKRCITGRRELERIERDMDAKIDREGQEILQKVADFLRKRKEDLKRQAHAHCRQCISVVDAYTTKCEELAGALRTLDSVLSSKSGQDLHPQNRTIIPQEKDRLEAIVQKLQSAVQQLDSPCHFTVRLIMDHSELDAVLATLKLGDICTGESSTSISERSAKEGPAGWRSKRSTPERACSGAASAFPAAPVRSSVPASYRHSYSPAASSSSLSAWPFLASSSAGSSFTSAWQD